MADDQIERLSAYMERALALRPQNQDELSPEELREVALELGLTEADLARAEAEGAEHAQRGEGFVRHGRFADAIREYREALILRPGHLDTMSALAWAHRRHWAASGDRESRASAEALARRCLDLDPRHDRSIKLLNELELPPATLSSPRTGLLVGLVAAAALLVAGMGAVASRKGPRTGFLVVALVLIAAIVVAWLTGGLSAMFCVG